ncbi:hypothetical protein RI129_002958 [Pyrocoelia pectoralis]|uniref:Uncharacterized protein n=1 Tax=Pyrocoelia pectoralis TaxID=417401 RepID=A0AAN7ZTZ0_9COLE
MEQEREVLAIILQKKVLGIPGLPIHAKIKEFRDLNPLLKVMNEIMTLLDKVSADIATSKKIYSYSGQVGQAVTNPLSSRSADVKCFNCNTMDHYLSEYPKPKRERGSCTYVVTNSTTALNAQEVLVHQLLGVRHPINEFPTACSWCHPGL